MKEQKEQSLTKFLSTWRPILSELRSIGKNSAKIQGADREKEKIISSNRIIGINTMIEIISIGTTDID